MLEKCRKIGIMGGTFNPIHVGHLLLGECAYEEFALDEVWFMPNGIPPHKIIQAGSATDQERLDMVKLAIETNPHFSVCSMEMEKQGYSYTYQTLEQLNQEMTDTEFYFIIGADSLFTLESWKNPERILAACKILVAVRDQVSRTALNEKIEEYQIRYPKSRFCVMQTGNFEVSSCMIRENVKKGRSIRYYTVESVRRYIEEHQIYLDLEE